MPRFFRLAQDGSGRPGTPKPPGSEKLGPAGPSKAIPPPLPKPMNPPQGFKPQVRQTPRENPAEMSPETKAMMQEAIAIAMRLKDQKDLPSNIRKEVMDLLDMSAHPALSKSKVTVQGARRFIAAARRILAAGLQGQSAWDRLSERRPLGPLGRLARRR